MAVQAMTYRITLTGAQGTGKSTLTRAIAACLRNADVDVQAFIGLGAEVAQAGHATGVRAGAETVRMFAALHRARESAASGAVAIFDRCLLDALAYAQVLNCLPRSEIDALRSAAVESCQVSGQRLWMRITHDYPVAGPQDESPEFRRAIDAAIGSLAREDHIDLIECAVPPQVMDEIAAAVCAQWRKDCVTAR